MVLNENGKSLTPAFVSFSSDGKILIGDSAKSQARSRKRALCYEHCRTRIGSAILPVSKSLDENSACFASSLSAQMAQNPDNTVYDLRRMLGATYAEVVPQAKLWSFRVVDSAGRPHVSVQFNGAQREFTPEQLCALVLSKSCAPTWREIWHLGNRSVRAMQSH